MKHVVLATLMALMSAQAPACPLSESLMTRYGISFSGFGTGIPVDAVDASLDNCRLEPTDGTNRVERHG